MSYADPSGPNASLRVDVQDVNARTVADARVLLRTAADRKESLELAFDDRLQAYVAPSVAVGDGVVEVEHGELEGQRREVRIEHGSNEELFLLAAPGVKTYFREKVRVPVDADPDLVAVTIGRSARSRGEEVDAIGRELGLVPVAVPELAKVAGARLYRTNGGPNASDAVARLSDHPLVEHAGAVVGHRKAGFSHLTRDVVVCFRSPDADTVRAIAREHGYTVLRDLAYSPGTYVLRWGSPATLDILDSIEALAARDDIEWAEPNLIVTPELDAVIPSDPLWPGLWDRQLIDAPNAWQGLQDAGLDTFGDPEIVLAVWDSGVQSSGGTPTNPDFQGTVSDGSSKVLAAFDFMNMVANNDSPWSDHGSGVAGVSVAKANNPAPLPGQTYGLVGSAPNVRVITIAGNPSNDVEIGDQYVWMAGFDPASPTPGFPAPLARGADVITCSLTPGAGAPLSGTAKATLDFVTTFGRGGKGTMCFFSTGNNNANNVTARPYGAYEKCFAVAATSYANDGVSEIRAPYSGWGQIALSAPSQDQFPAFHNPPTGFAPWAGAHSGQGNMISYRQVTTTLSAASVVAATTLTVASAAGLAANQVIHVGTIGAVGSEPARIVAVNAVTNQLTVQGFNGSFGGGLINAHAAGIALAMGPANHKNNFGGTSSATPLCAGVAALVLSADPDLTYVEARQVMRDSAVRFDLANTDPVGQWLDVDGNPSVTSGLPPVKSGWYGYGRVDAAVAVQGALTFAGSRDLVIRDNLADTGAVASSGAFWNSPDIWCRRQDPASDPGAIPASYAAAGPHETPLRGQPNWVYARVRNNGTQTSLDAWVRLSIAHYPGLEFTYPGSFESTNGPGDPVPSPMTPGTYFIGEAKVTGLPPGADQIVQVQWPTGLIPPASVIVSGSSTQWHPCLLAEITPHDGPSPTGNHVWDDNNLGQKNISIVNADSGGDFAFAIVIGHEDNVADHLLLEINRGKLPREVQLYVDLVDPILRRRMRRYLDVGFQQIEPEHVAGDGDGDGNGHGEGFVGAGRGAAIVLAPATEQVLTVSPALQARKRGWTLGFYDGHEVVFVDARGRPRVPIYGGRGSLNALVVGGIVGPDVKPGEYEVVLLQRQPSGRVTGSASLSLTIRKPGKSTS